MHSVAPKLITDERGDSRMVDGPGSSGGASRPNISENADGGLNGPKESIFEVLKPVLVLVGMLVVLFLLLVLLG